ncbi:PREDICTED: uncharacterized protein LOC109241733 [Nicotiana attenuata]|uniref:uncharacterized protein LOC109241733 n=1 Tax=Nicotiana attenuata TaxID=49451 RepID=UPI0009050E8D|nr:PREDICTED: uncharacterized protein LOC109241733 [Nicotiana attenuata]
MTYHTSEQLAKIYVREIVRLYGDPISIISRLGPQFTSYFWRTVSCALGTQVDLSTTFHPQLPVEYPDGSVYGRHRFSPMGWFEPVMVRLLGTDLVHDALEKEGRDVAFMTGEKVLLRVSPMNGMKRFWKKGKFSPRYIGPFKVLERVSKMAYQLALPPSLSVVPPLFHVFMIWKYYEDLPHVLDFILVHLDEKLPYEEELVAILDRQFWKLRSKNISSMKVQWRGQSVEEATWHTEHDM